MAKTQTAGQAVGTIGRRHYSTGGTTDGRRFRSDLGSRGRNMAPPQEYGRLRGLIHSGGHDPSL